MPMDKTNQDIPFLITISYLISFFFIRLVVFIAGSANTEFARAAGMGQSPEVKFAIGRNIILFGYHFHHFYFGILMICIAGWMSITGSHLLSRKQVAVLYGAGLGLFMDEVGLLLTWGDYFSSISYLLSLLLAGLFLSIVFFQPFWEEMKKNLQEAGPSSFVWKVFSGNTGLFRMNNWIGEKIGKTDRTSLAFTGILSLAVSILIVLSPQFLRYCVFGVFVLQGLTHLVRAWES